MNRARTSYSLIVTGALVLAVGVALIYVAGLHGLIAKVLVCLWLFFVPGMGLVLWTSRRMSLQVFLGLSVALSWATIIVLLWAVAFAGWPFSSVFWMIWITSALLMVCGAWRAWSGSNLCRIEAHPSSWVVILMVIVLGTISGFQDWVGPSADIFPTMATSGRFWAAGWIVKEDPLAGPGSNYNFNSMLALAGHVAGTHPLDMLDTERALFATLLGTVYASLPCLMGFGVRSSVGFLLFLTVLLPGQFTGGMAFHYQNWALGLALAGLFLVVSYLAQRDNWSIGIGLILLAGGAILHDFVLFFSCAAFAVMTGSWLIFHFRDNGAWRRALTVGLLACVIFVPIGLVRKAQLGSSIAEVNAQKWSRGPKIELFGHGLRYFPMAAVEKHRGFPVAFNLPTFLLLMAATWVALSWERRKALFALMIWPVCVLAFPPFYHGLSEIVGLPTVRRLPTVFPIFEAILFGGVVATFGLFSWKSRITIRSLVFGLAVATVVVLRLPGAAVYTLNQFEYHPPGWSDGGVWAWADAYQVLRLKRGEAPSVVLDAPFLMHQGVTSGLTTQKSLLGHSMIQDEDTYARLVATARALDPFVGREDTLKELNRYKVRYVILNEHHVPRTSRAKFARWTDHFRLIQSSHGCHIYEYLGSRPESLPVSGEEDLDILTFAPNISAATSAEVPSGFEPVRFDNGIVLRGTALAREGNVLNLSFWWSRTGDYDRGFEIANDIHAERYLRRGSSDSYRVCFTLFYADLYGRGSFRALQRRLWETLGQAPSRLAPYNQMLRMSRHYPHSMVWKDWPQTIFECWPPLMWKEGEVWREQYELIIPKNLIPGRYQLRVRQGSYPDDDHLGEVVSEIVL